tara:strand:+ start:243 stop:773 length:531 start_codon:yes stop_codon:yes gene_type:complete
MPKVIQNILPSILNKKIINILINTKGWYFGNDKNNFLNAAHSMEADQGMVLVTHDENLKIEKNENFNLLNICGEFIARLTLDKAQMDQKWAVKRVNWNFYHTKSKGKEHIDSETPGCVSILYNLNTNNGCTIINNKGFKSNESESIIFSSNKLHQGVGCDTQLRYNLNLILRNETV